MNGSVSEERKEDRVIRVFKKDGDFFVGVSVLLEEPLFILEENKNRKYKDLVSVEVNVPGQKYSHFLKGMVAQILEEELIV